MYKLIEIIGYTKIDEEHHKFNGDDFYYLKAAKN